MTRVLILASFVMGLVPVTILLFLYAARTPWRADNNPAGKAMLGLFIATESGYLLTVASLIFPEWSMSPSGEWLRIVLRTMIGSIFWVLLWVFGKAQKAGAAHEEALAGLETAKTYIQEQPGQSPPAPDEKETNDAPSH